MLKYEEGVFFIIIRSIQVYMHCVLFFSLLVFGCMNGERVATPTLPCYLCRCTALVQCSLALPFITSLLSAGNYAYIVLHKMHLNLIFSIHIKYPSITEQLIFNHHRGAGVYPRCQRVRGREKSWTDHHRTHIRTHIACSASLVHLTCMSLTCGRKPETQAEHVTSTQKGHPTGNQTQDLPAGR